MIGYFLLAICVAVVMVLVTAGIDKDLFNTKEK